MSNGMREEVVGFIRQNITNVETVFDFTSLGKRGNRLRFYFSSATVFYSFTTDGSTPTAPSASASPRASFGIGSIASAQTERIRDLHVPTDTVKIIASSAGPHDVMIELIQTRGFGA